MTTPHTVFQLRTPAEIQALKINWLKDPCWDIEDTLDFEGHYKELRDWRLQHKRKWARTAFFKGIRARFTLYNLATCIAVYVLIVVAVLLTKILIHWAW